MICCMMNSRDSTQQNKYEFRKIDMDTDKLFIYNIQKVNSARTDFYYRDTLARLSRIKKEPITLFDDFQTAFHKEIIELALSHGCMALWNMGISLFDITHSINHLKAHDAFNITEDEKQKLVNDCDELGQWIFDHSSKGDDMTTDTHNAYKSLNALRHRIKS